MQLVYRGISYQATSMHAAAAQQVVNGKYRGIAYQIRRKVQAALTGIYVLKYRGIDYIRTLN